MQALYSNPLYIIGPALLLFIGFILFMYFKGKGKKGINLYKKGQKLEQQAIGDTENEQIIGKDRPNALICFPNRTFGLRQITLIEGRNYGRQWLYNSRLVFWLQQTAGGVFTPIVPATDLEHSPTELYDALQTREDVNESLAPTKDSDKAIKIGLLVLVACVSLFLMFVYVAK